jgi:hypothetical protein
MGRISWIHKSHDSTDLYVARGTTCAGLRCVCWLRGYDGAPGASSCASLATTTLLRDEHHGGKCPLLVLAIQAACYSPASSKVPRWHPIQILVHHKHRRLRYSGVLQRLIFCSAACRLLLEAYQMLPAQHPLPAACLRDRTKSEMRRMTADMHLLSTSKVLPLLRAD